ncbi:isoliquiritigenin 2'-O-methyltransferase-like [Neltuma alba]|uniref:isoliquiritigenin 2'-O-methyltransferase-like n=1 Tax=Neltuma alba TaxID=207710 RepID=UPI0010A43269|nr:isoliquiritigenin 2'-O-methyltransferase-like [Prosopis alba]
MKMGRGREAAAPVSAGAGGVDDDWGRGNRHRCGRRAAEHRRERNEKGLQVERIEFMAANLTMLEAVSEEKPFSGNKIHVAYFGIRKGNHYTSLPNILTTHQNGKPATTGKFLSVAENDVEEGLKMAGGVAAIDLNLFEIIGKGSLEGMSPSGIASKLENPYAGMTRRLDRMLFLLSNYSLLTCSSNKLDQHGRMERFYALSRSGKKNFKQVILDEEEDLFRKVHGMPMYMEMDPTFKTTFHGAMVDLSTMMMKYVLETYKGFEGISTLVDVGGGIGQSLKMVISKYPSNQGINFDLPQVIQHALSCPDGSDGHKHVSIADNLMLVQPGGKERTEKEFEALCKDSGFSSYRIAACVASTALGVIEFYK